jgi:hypothetical protein
MTIHLPPEVAMSLAAEADRLGTTPELLAVEVVRRSLPATDENGQGAKNLLEFLEGYVGTVDGPTEALSQDCGKHFAEGLAADRASKK